MARLGLGCLGCLAVLACAHEDAGPEVQTDKGPVQGKHDTKYNVDMFYGIPFASATSGKNRFAAPVPPKPWGPQPKETKTQGAMCAQTGIVSKTQGSENCLNLDVVVPKQTEASAPLLPVLFYIYGGAWWFGDKFQSGQYDARKLATKGVIVVSANYRVDIFSGLALPELLEESPLNSTGNNGILDQRLALEWVQANIKAFGGDPDRVTIFGGSAGAMDICVHLTSPASAGLFSAAIMESASCDSPFIYRTREEAFAWSTEFLEARGCKATKSRSLLECARSKPISELVTSLLTWGEPDWPFTTLPRRVPQHLPQLAPIVAWSTVIDGSPFGVMDVPRRRMGKAGTTNDVPVILGYNRNEGSIFAPEIHLIDPAVRYPLGDNRTALLAIVGHLFPDQAEAIVSQYSDTSVPGNQFKNYNQMLVAIITDGVFACATRRTAMALSKQSKPVFMYHFEFNSTEFAPTSPFALLGDFHGSEVQFIFNNIPATAVPDSVAMASVFQHYWINFATTGNPNLHTPYTHAPSHPHTHAPMHPNTNAHITNLQAPTPLPLWSHYDVGEQRYMQLDHVPRNGSSHLAKQNCDFWDGIEQR